MTQLSKVDPSPSAENINEQHRLAKTTAERAVEHAIECGYLLRLRKQQLGHGELQAWIEENCDFKYATAARYMSAAKNNARGVAFASLRQLFPSGRPEPRTFAPPENSTTSDQISTAVENSSESRQGPTAQQQSGPPNADERPEWVPERPEWDADEDAALAAAERELQASVDKVMAADDRLAAAYEVIKRQADTVASLKISCNGWQNGRSEVIKLLKAEQLTTKRLGKKLRAEVAITKSLKGENDRLKSENESLRNENESLRERVAIMSEAA
jgi:hypothetical protein